MLTTTQITFEDWRLEILQVPGTEHFLGTFYFLIKPVLLIVR